DPPNGTATLNMDGSVTYTPDLNFFGTDTFNYTICDPGQDGNASTTGDNLCDSATVTMTVDAVNDAPVAVNDSASTNEDVYVDIDVIANDNDVDNTNAQLSVAEITDIQGGTAVLQAGGHVVRVTPATNDHDGHTPGGFSLKYKAKDVDNAESNQATVTISVAAVNDPPDAVNDRPAAFVEDSVNNAIDVLGNDTDVDNFSGPANAGLSVTAVTQGGHGAVTFTATGVSYTPAANYYGPDSFTYTISDGEFTDTATVNVNINNVNDTPNAIGDAATVAEDSGANTINVLANDTDADNLSGPANFGLTVTAVTQGTNGSVTNNGTNVSYTPNANFYGSDRFTYTVCDAGQDGSPGNGDDACDTATVNVTVTNVNDTPDAIDDSATVAEDTTNNVFDVLANDTDADNLSAPFNAGLSVTGVTQGAHGSVTFTATSVSYTPAANYYGPDSF